MIVEFPNVTCYVNAPTRYKNQIAEARADVVDLTGDCRTGFKKGWAQFRAGGDRDDSRRWLLRPRPRERTARRRRERGRAAPRARLPRLLLVPSPRAHRKMGSHAASSLVESRARSLARANGVSVGEDGRRGTPRQPARRAIELPPRSRLSSATARLAAHANPPRQRRLREEARLRDRAGRGRPLGAPPASAPFSLAYCRLAAK